MAQTLRVIDTSAWIEWLVKSPLGQKLDRQIPDKTRCIGPTIVQLGLSEWLTREIGEDEADLMIPYNQRCRIVALDTSIALLAAEMHRQHKLATADAIVYATARSQGADVLTCDAQFEGLPDVVLFAKV